MTATRTSLRRISRIQEYYRSPGEFGFVRDKLLQLVERPAMQIATLRATNPYPLADALQILKSNPAAGVFSPIHNLFADTMIFLLDKTLFLAGKTFQNTTRRSGSFGLQSATLAEATAANTEHVRPAVLIAVTIGGYVDNTHIDAQNAINVNRFGRFDLAGNEQVEVTSDKAQVGFASVAMQEFKSPVATNERNTLPAVECPDGHLPFGQIERQDTGIVGETAVHLETAPFLLADSVTVGDFGNGANNHLCGKVEPLADGMVSQLVQAELSKHLFGESLFTNPVTRAVGFLKRGFEKFVLFRRRLQFDLRRQLHIVKFSTDVLLSQATALRAVRIPLPLKRGSVLRSFL